MHYQSGVLYYLNSTFIVCIIGVSVSLHLLENLIMCQNIVMNSQWLTVPSLIKYHCLRALHKIYLGEGLVLGPPIVFGTSHGYPTWSSGRCIQPLLCRLRSYLNIQWLPGGMIYLMMFFWCPLSYLKPWHLN